MANTGTYSRAALATRRFRFVPRAAWMGARARNVLQRPWRLLVVWTVLFTGVLLAYLFLPAGAQGVARLIRQDEIAWRDTTVLLMREQSAKRARAVADAAVAEFRRSTAALMALRSAGSSSPEEARRRAFEQREAAELARLIQRAEGAPLPESFRALASAPVLRDDPRVRALADTVEMIARERDDLGAGATVDPVFVALTTQLNEAGHRIVEMGQERLAAIRRPATSIARDPIGAVIDSLSGAPVRDTSAVSALADSHPVFQTQRRAAAAFENARRSLEAARAANAAADSAAARQRARLQLAPMPVLAIGAGVIALVVAFALALFDEMRSPRVADAAEAERLTELRALGVAKVRPIPADRVRRAADRQLPAILDPTFDAYRVLSWHLTSEWPRDGIVTVTGDNVHVAATVAANLAAVLANDARVTLLVDAELESEPVRALLELPRSPGLAAVVENRRKWSEALVPIVVGRGRTMDVLPAGGRQKPLGPAESQALVTELQRASRRYDATIVVTGLAGAKRFRAGDTVIVCATQTRTRLATLARTVASLVDGGARVRGVVLWDGPLPRIASDARIAFRPPLPAVPVARA
jgi:Mrp family chromosome partitioning ATPase